MKWLRVDRDRAFSALVNLQLIITTQSLAHRAPLSNGMAGLDLWRHGAWHPQGGVGAIGRTLLQAFEQHGGQTRFATRVVKAERAGEVWCLETDEGTLRARNVVTNVPIWNLPRLVPAARVESLERRAGEGWGAVTLYIALRDEAVPADFPLHAQVLTRYAPTPL